MRGIARLTILGAIGLALAAGAWLASRGTGRDRRDLEPLVTLGGDAARDALRPALDLTRLPASEEAALGDAIDARVRASLPVGGSARDEAYVDSVLRTLTPFVSRPGMPYRIAVVRTAEVNAFSVAGGRLYVTEGLISFARSEAELAVVIAHEIAHVDLRHCVSRLQIEIAARKVDPGAAAIAAIGYQVMALGFSEEQELAADVAGAKLAAQAAYDPWAAGDLFARLGGRQADRLRRPSRNPVEEAASVVPEMLRRYLATHPPAEERIESVRRTLVADPSLWKGRRRYVGAANLDARRSLAQEPLAGEWIVRESAPA